MTSFVNFSSFMSRLSTTSCRAAKNTKIKIQLFFLLMVRFPQALVVHIFSFYLFPCMKNRDFFLVVQGVPSTPPPPSPRAGDNIKDGIPVFYCISDCIQLTISYSISTNEGIEVKHSGKSAKKKVQDPYKNGLNLMLKLVFFPYFFFDFL